MTIAEEMRAHAKAARGRLRRSPNAKPDHGGEMNFRWTKENIGRLKALVADSLTASQIAAVLGDGVTRNSVIGKIHRLGLSLASTSPYTTVKNGRVSRPRAARNGGAAANKARQQQERAIRAKIGDNRVKAVVLARATALGELPACEAINLPADAPTVALLDLKPNDCRWPIDGPDGTVAQRRFCGCERANEGSPYCRRHHALAH